MTGGYRAYARHRGCALYAVQKALATGRIVATPDKLIDFDAADAAWALATDAAMQRKEPPPEPPPAVLPILDGVVEQAPSGLAKHVKWDEWPLSPPVPAPMDLLPPTPANLVDGDTFMHWRTREQRANAIAAERDLAKQEKRLLDADDAARTFTAVGKMYATARENVPAQLAPQLVGLTDLGEIERRVRDAFRAADLRIADEIRSRFAEIIHDASAAG